MGKLGLLLFVFIVGLVMLNGCGKEPEETTAEVNFNIEIPNLAPYAAISKINVTVTANPNDDTILATAPLTIQNNIATGKVTVLAGKSRVFKIEARDSDNNVIGTGEAKADVVAGRAVTVDVTIELVTGDVNVNGHWEDGNGGSKPTADIMPGEKVAGVNLLGPFNSAKKLYGKPVMDRNNPDIFIYDDIGLLGVVYDLDEDGLYEDSEPIIMLMVAWPYKGKTAGGNGIDSVQTNVEKEFGKAEKVEADAANDLEYYWYYKKGISFAYDIPTRAALMITIFPPEAAAPKAFKQERELLQRLNLIGYRLNSRR